nr:NADH dehydrogenase subunit 3 [Chlamisus sp. N29]
MNLLIKTLGIVLTILMIMMTLLNFLAKKTFMDREKSSPFESGFDPKSSSRLPFSLQFFLIAVIFLIFDIEIVLLFPLIKIIKSTNMTLYSLSSMMFIAILIIGLFHELNQGALDWKF